MTTIDPAPAERLISVLYRAGYTSQPCALLAEMLTPEGLHDGTRGAWDFIHKVSRRLTLLGYTVEEEHHGFFRGIRFVITDYTPLTPHQRGALRLRDALWRGGTYTELLLSLRPTQIAAWTAGATVAELDLAIWLVPDFPGPWEELVAVVEAMCAAPTQGEVS